MEKILYLIKKICLQKALKDISLLGAFRKHEFIIPVERPQNADDESQHTSHNVIVCKIKWSHEPDNEHINAVAQ